MDFVRKRPPEVSISCAKGTCLLEVVADAIARVCRGWCRRGLCQKIFSILLEYDLEGRQIFLSCQVKCLSITTTSPHRGSAQSVRNSSVVYRLERMRKSVSCWYEVSFKFHSSEFPKQRSMQQNSGMRSDMLIQYLDSFHRFEEFSSLSYTFSRISIYSHSTDSEISVTHWHTVPASWMTLHRKNSLSASSGIRGTRLKQLSKAIQKNMNGSKHLKSSNRS